MIKVVCLSDYHYELRQIMTIAEGLIQHPEVDAILNQPYIYFGKIIQEAVSKDELNQSLMDCDIITMPNVAHFGCKPSPKARPYPPNEYLPFDIGCFIEDNSLWNKVVYLDIRDESYIDMAIYHQCLAYFKRTSMHWNPSGTNPHGIFVPMSGPMLDKKPIYPLPIGILDAYWELQDTYKVLPKIIDVGYYFDWNRLLLYGAHYSRRISTFTLLENTDWGNINAKIGHVWPNYNAWDHPILKKPEEIGGSWVEYMRLINQSKVIFDCLPTRYNQTNRPVEAMSTGNLCFFDKDESYVPMRLKHEKHCFYYDASNTKSVNDAIDLVKYYLKPENEKERLRIAKAGFKHAKKYHNSINRVDCLLNIVKGLM